MDTNAQSPSFYPPQEPDWHRAIAEAAYYLAQKRGFTGDNVLGDWITAEQQVKQVISPTLDSQEQPKPIADMEERK